VSTSADGRALAVVAHYRVRPGKGDEVAAILREHLAATRAEPGNLEFLIHRSTEDPDEFAIYERYDSRESIDAHVASPHYEKYVTGQVRPLLDERTVGVYHLVEP
jgi:quinol monooxygenase YgiN